MTEPLIPNAFYNHYGRVMIAFDESSLIGVSGDLTRIPPTADTELMDRPGDEGWVARMVHIHIQNAVDLSSERAEVTRVREHLQELGQALLEKAVEKGWCEEYDTFADEWDLPARCKEFDVTVAVRVSARDEEAALDLVRDNVSLTPYHNDVIEGPDFSADRIV